MKNYVELAVRIFELKHLKKNCQEGYKTCSGLITFLPDRFFFMLPEKQISMFCANIPSGQMTFNYGAKISAKKKNLILNSDMHSNQS